MIALAVAVTVRGDGCITVHTKEALDHGATQEEIAQALGAAVAVNAETALVFPVAFWTRFDSHRD